MLTFSGFPLAIFSGSFISFLVITFLGFSGDNGGFIGDASCNILLGVFNGTLL